MLLGKNKPINKIMEFKLSIGAGTALKIVVDRFRLKKVELVKISIELFLKQSNVTDVKVNYLDLVGLEL